MQTNGVRVCARARTHMYVGGGRCLDDLRQTRGEDFITPLILGPHFLKSSSKSPLEASVARLLSVSPGCPGREKMVSLLSFSALSLHFLVDFPNLRPRSWEGLGAPHSELTAL